MSVFLKKLKYSILDKLYNSIHNNSNFKNSNSFIYLLLNLIEYRRYPHPQLLYDPMTDNRLQILSPPGKKRDRSYICPVI